VGVAEPARGVAGEGVLGLVDERRQGRAEQGQVDPLAARRAARRAFAAIAIAVSSS